MNSEQNENTVRYWTFKHKPGQKASAADIIPYLREALKNTYCMCQYEYDFQTTAMVTQTWSVMMQPKPGDIVFLRGDRTIHAVGKIIEPRTTGNANVELSAQAIINSKAHGENNQYRSDCYKGTIIFSDAPAFYEFLDGEQENWGQRIDVDAWQYYVEGGIWIDESNYKSKSDVYLPIRELNAESGQFLHKELIMKSKGNASFLLLDTHKNIILNGAPGTGKTYTARQMAAIKLAISIELPDWEEKLNASSQFEFVQFHPGYSYADFVEGLKPQPVSGGVKFERMPGIFMKFCETASKPENENKEFVIVIDEINRADLSRVFGELFYGIEENYRGHEFLTQYSYLNNFKRFSIPGNITIIGTMNDIDRSIDSMDFALRRRFVWHEITAEESKIILNKLDDADKEKSQRAMDALNAIIGKELGTEYQIGGAYFLNVRKYNGDFNALWMNHIFVILNEYLRGMRNKKEIWDQLEQGYNEAIK